MRWNDDHSLLWFVETPSHIQRPTSNKNTNRWNDGLLGVVLQNACVFATRIEGVGCPLSVWDSSIWRTRQSNRPFNEIHNKKFDLWKYHARRVVSINSIHWIRMLRFPGRFENYFCKQSCFHAILLAVDGTIYILNENDAHFSFPINTWPQAYSICIVFSLTLTQNGVNACGRVGMMLSYALSTSTKCMWMQSNRFT